jgi:predicted Zn-dependent protease
MTARDLDVTDDAQRFLDLAEAAVRAAVSAGASHAEAVSGRSRGVGVVVENTSVKSAETGSGEALSIRAFVNGAAARTTVEGLEGVEAAALGAECARMAAGATPDPDFVDLPHPDPANEVEGLHDEAVEPSAAMSHSRARSPSASISPRWPTPTTSG